MLMTVGELLDQVRTYYLNRFKAAVEVEENNPGVTVIVESPYFDSSGEPKREGVFNLPARGDIFVLGEGGPWKVIHLDTKNMLKFDPIEFEWEHGLGVLLSSFQWNWCPLEISPARSAEQLTPIVEWFERWFEGADKRQGVIDGAVHFMSDPERRESSVKLDIDLGSAPVEAFEELLDSCAAAGATSVTVGSIPEA